MQGGGGGNPHTERRGTCGKGYRHRAHGNTRTRGGPRKLQTHADPGTHTGGRGGTGTKGARPGPSTQNLWVPVGGSRRATRTVLRSPARAGADLGGGPRRAPPPSPAAVAPRARAVALSVRPPAAAGAQARPRPRGAGGGGGAGAGSLGGGTGPRRLYVKGHVRGARAPRKGPPKTFLLPLYAAAGVSSTRARGPPGPRARPAPGGRPSPAPPRPALRRRRGSAWTSVGAPPAGPETPGREVTTTPNLPPAPPGPP